MQPRPSEVKKALPPLTYQQEEMLKKAKRYAMEQSVQQVGHLRVLQMYMCTKLVVTDCSIDCHVPFQNNTQEATDQSECATCISVIIYMYLLTIYISEWLMQVGRTGLSERF